MLPQGLDLGQPSSLSLRQAGGERLRERYRTLSDEECAARGHFPEVEVIGGLTCGCGWEFEFQYHASAIPPKKPST